MHTAEDFGRPCEAGALGDDFGDRPQRRARGYALRQKTAQPRSRMMDEGRRWRTGPRYDSGQRAARFRSPRVRRAALRRIALWLDRLLRVRIRRERRFPARAAAWRAALRRHRCRRTPRHKAAQFGHRLRRSLAEKPPRSPSSAARACPRRQERRRIHARSRSPRRWHGVAPPSARASRNHSSNPARS